MKYFLDGTYTADYYISNLEDTTVAIYERLKDNVTCVNMLTAFNNNLLSNNEIIDLCYKINVIAYSNKSIRVKKNF